MTAAACLQILISQERIATHGDVRAAVARVTNAYLETHWSWPKRYVEMCPTSYMLTDPESKELVSGDVQALSKALQTRLFGEENSGDVEIALFEGSQADAMLFATLTSDEVRQILDSETDQTFGLRGRILRVRTESVDVVREIRSTFDQEAGDSEGDGPATRIIFRGVYLTPKQQFVSSIASRWSAKDGSLQSILNGPGHFPQDQECFDRETIEALLDTYPNAAATQGVIHLPLSYTNICRRGAAARYVQYFETLKDWGADHLVGQVYDAPRTPNYVALAEMKKLIAPNCSAMDLMITDPDTDFLALKPGLLRSITLALPNADETLREAAIRRFLARKTDFREKRVWPVIGNLRTRREMQVCNAAGGLLMYGPGLTGLLESPAATANFPLSGLPMTGDRAEPNDMPPLPSFSRPARAAEALAV